MRQTVPIILRRMRPFGLLCGLVLLLSGQARAQITNDNCAQAIAVPVSANCSMPLNGTVQDATQSLPAAPNCSFGIQTVNDVWYSFVATGSSQQITLAPRFAATLDVRSGSCATSTSVFCSSVFNGNTNPTLVGGLTSGQTYFIRIYANGSVPPAGISSTFALCVSPGPVPPVNDDCAGALTVPVQASGLCSNAVSSDNTNATGSTGVPAPGCASYQGADVWFRVTVPASGSLTVQTVQPSSGTAVFDTGLSLYAGTCISLTQISCDDDAGGGGFSLLSVSGRTPGEVLYARAWGYGGGRGTLAVCALTYTPPANDNCAQAVVVPVSTSCASPTTGTVAAATQSLAPAPNCAFGSSTANDVWYQFTATGTTQTITLNANYSAVVDVRSGTCTTSSSVFCSSGFGGQPRIVSGLTVGQTYFLRVYADGNFQPSPVNASFTLCVSPGPVPPANDECAGAISVPVTTGCTTPTSGTIANATQSLAPSATCGFGSVANDVWYRFVATGTTQTITLNTGFNAVLEVRGGTCTTSTSVYCTNGFAGQGVVAGGLTSGQTYFIRVYSDFGGQPFNTTFSLCVSPGPTPPANDECAGAISVPVTTGCATPVTGTIANASQSLAPSATCGFGSVANDVWYRFVATGTTQTITLNTGFNAVLEVRGGTCASSTSVYCTNGFTGQGVVAGGLTSGQTYFIRVYSDFGSQPFNTTFSLCVSPGPTPPANDECAGAINVPVALNCGTPVTGTIANASQSLAPTTNCGFGSVANDVWYSFVATGTTQTLTFSAPFQAVLDVRSGTCASSTSVFCASTFAAQGIVASGLTSGQAYFLRIYNVSSFQPGPGNSSFTLCVTPGPPPSANDECAQAVAIAVVQSCATSTNGTIANSSQSLPPTASCGTTAVANDVWYSFVAVAPSQLITLTSRFQAVLEVRSGTCASSASRFCTTVFPNSTTGTVVGGLTTGQTYFIRIYANGPFLPPPTSATFTLCINPAPTPPANDECAQAVTVPVATTCTTPTTGTVEGASQSMSPTANCGNPSAVAQDVWYRFTATGATHFITLNAGFSAVVDVRSGACATSASLSCSTVFPGQSGNLIGGFTSGQTYYLRVYASGNQQPSPLNANFTLCINPGPVPPANDECAGAVVLPVTATCTPTTGSVAAASQSLPPAPTCSFGGVVANDVWYRFVATGTAHSITLAQQFGAVLEVRSGTCASSASIFCAGVQTNRPALVGGLTVGDTYFIRVYAANANPSGPFANFTICVTPAPTPPANDDCAGAIDVPVQFGTSCQSQTIGSNVAATGSNAPAPGCASYQGEDIWFKVTVPASGNLDIRTVVPATGADVGDTGLAVYSGTCANLTQLGCNDDSGGGYKSLLSFTGRTTGEVLYIRVWTYSGSTVGNLAVCVTSPTTCAEPSSLVATSPTSSGASLSWQPGGTPAAGTTYTVEYGLQGFLPGMGTLVPGLTSASTQLSGLQPSTAYCFYVRQNCPGTSGSSAYVGPVCFTTTAIAPGTCTPPSALATANVDNTSADLSWLTGGMPAAGTTYTVEYGLQGFTPGSGTLVTGLSSPSLQLTMLQPGTAYCFYVRQNCPGTTGSSAFVGPVCFTTTTPMPGTCAAPALLASNNVGNTSASLSWQPGGTPAAGTTYTVEYGLQGFLPGTGTLVSGLTSASLQLTMLQPGTAYCFYVRQNCPGTTGSSAYVGPVCFTTTTPMPGTCAAPSALAAGSITSATAQLSWLPGGTPAPGTTYTVEHGPQGFTLGSGIQVLGIQAPTVQVSGLLPGASNCYYVRQNCPGTVGSSAFTGPFCFQTLPVIPVPLYDEPCGAQPLVVTLANDPLQPVTGSTVNATTSTQPGIGSPNCSPGTTPRDVWYAMTPTVSSVTLSLTGAAAGMVRVFTAADCGNGPFVAVMCQSSGANNTGLTSVTLTSLTPGQRYYVAISGYNNGHAPGTFTLAASNTLTATRTQLEAAAVQVFPNPSSTGQLTLRLSELRAAGHATLFNAVGQAMLRFPVPAGSSEQVLKTRSLATGLYTLRVVVGTDVLTRKVVLE